jgi:predicted ATPase
VLHLAGDLEEFEKRIDSLVHLSEQHGLAIYYPEARMFEAWLRVARDHDRTALSAMQDYLEQRSAMGTTFYQTYFLMLVADAHLRLGQADRAMAMAREGIARAERTGERLGLAALHRLAAACHLTGSDRDAAAAEAALQAAITDARAQGARMWELRASRDLARLWRDQGRRDEARALLAPVYGWFTEGLDTPDLRETKEILDML